MLMASTTKFPTLSHLHSLSGEYLLVVRARATACSLTGQVIAGSINALKTPESCNLNTYLRKLRTYIHIISTHVRVRARDSVFLIFF